jgi:molybdate transport system ATP-binding protein
MKLTVNVHKQFTGGPLVQAELSLDLDRFGITVLFGPSGCGKTTLLRLISGLEQPDGGRISLGGVPWFQESRQVPAHQRRVGYVFQEGALFPHLSVAGNIAFGLSRNADLSSRVTELIRRVGLAGLEHRHPGELSGGQKQRVALARALAPKPQLVLLDEPFASLDRLAAEGLRHELRTLLQADNIPALLVTHDRDEALSLGDRMLRMEAGRIVQQGRPEEVLSGLSPTQGELGAESVVLGRVVGRREGLLCLKVGSAQLFAPDPGGEVHHARLCIRSEGVTLECAGSTSGSSRNHLAAKIVALEIHGALARVHLDCGFPLESLITAWACKDLNLRAGDSVTALVKATAIRVLPVEGEA